MTDSTPSVKKTFHMSDTVYDRLKFLALVLLPALGTLYFTVGGLFDLGYTEQVLGSIVALETFLGAVLGLSNSAHKAEIEARPDSTLVVSDDGEVYAEFAFDPQTASQGDEVTLRVVKP